MLLVDVIFGTYIDISFCWFSVSWISLCCVCFVSMHFSVMQLHSQPYPIGFRGDVKLEFNMCCILSCFVFLYIEV